jgi:2-polyprenyl-6-methoxyphenol hydroxylase-like FAD-dependent oxidoreductase
MTEHAVVIAGAGPTGMMLAAELALAEVDVVVVERRATPEPDRALAGGLHARTLEVLAQRGVADRFVQEGTVMQIAGFGRIRLDISDFPSRYNYGIALPQIQTERLLAAWVEELGVPTMRDREVTGFAQDDAGVDVALSDGLSLRADYLVGCDGGRSMVRKAAGIDFDGWDPSTSWLMAEVAVRERPDFGLRPGGGIGPVEGGDRIRVVLTEAHVEHTGAPTLHDVREALVAVDGTDYGAHGLSSASRFTDNTRQAVSYRKGRVLLAGDAAHVHPPLGGQGLNTGVQDAVNLGWKLAQVVARTSPEGLLDTYHEERHPVGARVLQNTMAQVALTSPGARHEALRDTMAELLGMDGPRKWVAAMMSGLDIHYDLGPGHPLLGRRMPDLDITTADGPRRVYELLHAAKPVLLDLDRSGVLDTAAWADRVQAIAAGCRGPWELPVLGPVSAPAAVLVRPDGYVGWVGDGTDDGVRDALTTWFGPA